MEDGTGEVLRTALGDLRRLLVGPDYPPATPVRPRRWWRRIRGYLVPVLLLVLVGLTAAAAQYLTDERKLPVPAAVLIGVGSTLPAALAPYRPLLAWRVGYLAILFGTFNTTRDEAWPWNPVQIIVFLFVLLLVAGRADTGVTAWAGLLTLLPVYGLTANSANAHGVTVFLAVLLILGDQVRRRRQSQRALVEQAERSELEQARRAVLEERTRIARELHDVVAHHMSMIAVQAETAPYRLTGLAEPARAEFSAIAGSAREALTDMRRLLGVLRSESTTPETAPQPGLAELPELVEAARRAGMSVTVDSPWGDGRRPVHPPPTDRTDGPEPADGVGATDGAGPAGNPAGPVTPVDPAGQPPEAVALAAYRIVQEALANAARHAPGAAVRVTLDTDGTALTVDVRNGPAGPGGSGGRGAGVDRGPRHGLTGMRERARLLGGTLTAGPTDQGYAVRAYLPYRAEESR
ncbi:histidine kinase [Plantactinospora sp. B5E13]|uniref:sensor histidine kinase n=1 Tax=unclassified Plantactinospora TaxID=2631981 RepID=UPI00325E9794